MIPDKTAGAANGHAGRLRRLLPDWPPARAGSADRRATLLAELTVRQFRRDPGTPGAWSRFLVAHARWIALVTLAVAGAAAALAAVQTPQYQSAADVVVDLPAAVATGQQPVMATEESIVSSGVVLGRAARSLHVPVSTLRDALAVSVPASTDVLHIAYSDPSPRIAQQRAQVIAQAYVAYRARHRPGTPVRRPRLPGAPTATLVTPASLPASPHTPNYLVDVGAAVVVGLALGLGSAALRDHLDDRVRGPADLEAQASSPVLGLIPAFRTARGEPAGRLAVVTAPGSVIAEAYRGLRTRVIQAAGAQHARTLLVTSPAWEERATVAGNLAAVIARSGRAAILVDADLRWGRVHELFGMAGSSGLAGVLERQTPLARAIQGTPVAGLRLLPAGPLPADPGAVLQRPAWRTTLSELRRQADVVIVVAPPLLVSPEAAPLAEDAEMILLVADARKSARSQVRTAAGELGPQRAKLVGCVLDNTGARHRLRPAPWSAAGRTAPDTWPGVPAAVEARPDDDGHIQAPGSGAALAGRAPGSPADDGR